MSCKHNSPMVGIVLNCDREKKERRYQKRALDPEPKLADSIPFVCRDLPGEGVVLHHVIDKKNRERQNGQLKSVEDHDCARYVCHPADEHGNWTNEKGGSDAQTKS